MPSTNVPPEARTHALPTALHQLQHHLYQTYLCPSSTYTQSSLFTQYAPLAVLLTIFALPRYVDLLPSSSASPHLWQILGHLLLGTGAALLALRVSIWLGARMVWAFCELDLGGHRKDSTRMIQGESADASEGPGVPLQMELTQGNLIFGGMFA